MKRIKIDMHDETELIIEFMGLPQINNLGSFDLKSILGQYDERKLDKDFIYHIETMSFSTSWDWLMPVLERIENNYSITFNIENDNCHLEGDIQISIYEHSKIESVYKAVIFAIEEVLK